MDESWLINIPGLTLNCIIKQASTRRRWHTPEKKNTLPSSQKQWRRLADGSEGHIEVHAAGMVSISNLQGRLYAKKTMIGAHGNSSTLHVEEIRNKF